MTADSLATEFLMKGHSRPSEKATIPRQDVFVSFASADKKVAQQIAGRLRQRGVSTWLDIETSHSGVDWRRTLRDAIDNSRSCVVLVSDNTSPPTQWLSTEWAAIQESAWRRPDLMVCPVVLDDADIPAFLRNWQTIRLSREEGNIEKVTDALIEVFGHRRGERTAGVSEREVSERAARFAEMIDTLTAAQKAASRK